MTHLRANAVLLALSLALCGVAYPLALWAVAQAAFPATANGSLVTRDGTVVGSRLVAQSPGDAYFWPRPSAAGYNAGAAGGSNWGASNPKLRDRVARQLGPIVKYKKGITGSPQADIAAWAAARGKADPEPAAAFFDEWLADPANATKVADLEPVPADMVTASGAGLDPHVTLRNALSVYQLDRVAAKRGCPVTDLEALVRSHAFTPLAGEPLVNVLELNLELDRRFPKP